MSEVLWDVWGGNRVVVAHANGLSTTYNHLQHVQVEVGDELETAQQLGTVGQTGARVTGPHLHFETFLSGKVVDLQSFQWIDGDRIIPALRSPRRAEEISAKDRRPVPSGKRDSKRVARSWGLQNSRIVVAGDEDGGAADASSTTSGDDGSLSPDDPPVTEPPVTNPPVWPPIERCVQTEAGGLDCPPPGPGLEDCPAPANGRTDCPGSQTVPEGSSSSATGSHGSAGLPDADRVDSWPTGPPVC